MQLITCSSEDDETDLEEDIKIKDTGQDYVEVSPSQVKDTMTNGLKEWRR